MSTPHGHGDRLGELVTELLSELWERRAQVEHLEEELAAARPRIADLEEERDCYRELLQTALDALREVTTERDDHRERRREREHALLRELRRERELRQALLAELRERGVAA